MLTVNQTTKSIEIVLDNLVETTELPYVACYVDVSKVEFEIISSMESDGVTNGTTPVTIVAAPATATTRKLNFLSLPNIDTAPVTVTIQVRNGADVRIVYKGTLAVGSNLYYMDTMGFSVRTGAVTGAGTTGGAVAIADGADPNLKAGVTANKELLVFNNDLLGTIDNSGVEVFKALSIQGSGNMYPVSVQGTVSLANPTNINANVSGINGAAFSLGSNTKVNSLPVTVASDQTLPVSGTFFQSTQPVSLASMPSTPVTGVFWQATQPVSGTFWQATQPISVASLPLSAGAATAALQAIPTLTKGTQGSTGYSVQNLKDASRNQTNFFMAAGIAGTSAEVMQSLTGYKGGAAIGATVTPAVVTAGKTFRIISITLSYQSLAAAGGMVFRLRANLSGVGVIGSPLVSSWVVGSAAAVAGITTTEVVPYPDGLEFSAGTGIAIGMAGLNTVGALAAAGFGTISIQGFEY